MFIYMKISTLAMSYLAEISKQKKKKQRKTKPKKKRKRWIIFNAPLTTINIFGYFSHHKRFQLFVARPMARFSVIHASIFCFSSLFGCTLSIVRGARLKGSV